MEKVRIGIIGCGGIANNKHMPALSKLPDVEMVAFCDVIVEHEIYGQITVDLILENRCDVQDFLDKISKSTARPLSILTNGKHYHTVEADREEIIDRIEQKLRLLGYLQETI